MKNATLKLKVSQDLKLIDKCNSEPFDRGTSFESTVSYENLTDLSLTLCKLLSNLSIQSTTWAKQRVAEHCNQAKLSHSSVILNNRNDTTFWNMYYPHLQILIKIN